MRTEKVSVNLSPVELGQIDYLVERGLFDSRSDFLRGSARKALEGHAAEIKQYLEPERFKSESVETAFSIGISILTKSVISEFIARGKRIRIRVIGMFTIANGITPEEIKQVVLSCKVHGKLVASKEIKEALREIEESENL